MCIVGEVVLEDRVRLAMRGCIIVETGAGTSYQVAHLHGKNVNIN